jgi:hypothetical protein
MDSVDMRGGIEDFFDDGGDEPAAKDRYSL